MQTTVLDEKLAPSLDEALAKLAASDRSAVAMRYLQGMSIREVGMALGVSEDAAKQRVFRAVEKLRGWFAARGLAAPTAMVVTWMSSAVRPAPSHIVRAILSRQLPRPRLAKPRPLRRTLPWWTGPSRERAPARNRLPGSRLPSSLSQSIAGSRSVTAKYAPPL